MQRARAGGAGDHPQHVGGDVLAGKGEHPRRQAGRRRRRIAVEAREVGVQALAAVREPAGGAPPQFGLPVMAVAAVVPALQPVAAPGLVFLEGGGQFTGQAPGRERVAAAEQGPQGREHRLARQRRVGQQRPQSPAQHRGVADRGVVAAGQVGLQRLGHELARRQEAQVGGDAMGFGQVLLQPSPHRRLRDQEGVRREHALPRRRLRQQMREHARQHRQVVAMEQAEVGPRARRVAHGAAAASSSKLTRWRTPGSSASTQ